MRFPGYSLAVLVLMSFAALAQVKNSIPQSDNGPQDDRSDPVATLASYFNAINARDYRRAYRLWDSPPSSFDQFARGFADTERVRLLVEPSPGVEGAAGSVYAEILTIVVASTRSAGERVFAGCYVMRRSNVQDRGWRIYRADVSQAPSSIRLSQILLRGCRK